MAQETDHFCSRCGNRVTHKPDEGLVQVLSPPEDQLVPSRYAEAGATDQAAGGTDQATNENDPAAGKTEQVKPEELREKR